MHTTCINRMSALAGFAPAGKLGHAHCSVLPVLALLAAPPAWSQTANDFRGSHRLIDMQVPADTPAHARRKFLTICPEYAQSVVANGIDNAVLVTGYYEDASSNYHGFVWHDGAFQTVDYPAAADTLLFGVNNRGVTIGFYGAGYFQGTDDASRIPSQPVHGPRFPTFQISRRISGTG